MKANDPEEILDAIGIAISIDHLYELIRSKYPISDCVFIADRLKEKFEKELIEIEYEIWSQ